MNQRHRPEVERRHGKDATDRVVDSKQHRHDHTGRGQPEQPAAELRVARLPGSRRARKGRRQTVTAKSRYASAEHNAWRFPE